MNTSLTQHLSTIKALTGVLCLIVLYPLLGVFYDSKLSTQDLQFLLLPLAFVLLYVGLPRALSNYRFVILTGCLALWTLLGSYHYLGGIFYVQDLVIARMPQDTERKDTTLFVKEIQQFMHAGDSPHLGIFYRPVLSATDAQRLLRYGSAFALLGGDEKWLQLNFKRNKFTRPLKVPITLSKRHEVFRLSRYVPSIGFSVEPRRQSAHFISLLLRSFDKPPQVAESYLQSAATYRSTWTTLSHLAYPYWRMGNIHIENFIEGGMRDSAELTCALEAYTEGATLLQPNDNPPLRASLFTNKAIALLLAKSATSGARKDAKKLFHKAADVANRDNPIQGESGIRKIANDNLERLYKRRS